MPAGYAVPYRKRDEDRATRVELGQAHTFAPIVLLDAVTFRARVVLADGTPATGAAVDATGPQDITRRAAVADAEGRFSFKNLPPDDAISPRVRLGKAVNVPEAIELDKLDGEATIWLSEANGAGFSGRVVDLAGQPLAGVKVGLGHTVWGVGRQSETGTSGGLGGGTALTDADGRYAFTARWPKDRYSVSATSEGYARAGTPSAAGVAGATHDFGTLRLGRAGLKVAGVVRDAADKPVAGGGTVLPRRPEADDRHLRRRRLVHAERLLRRRRLGVRPQARLQAGGGAGDAGAEAAGRRRAAGFRRAAGRAAGCQRRAQGRARPADAARPHPHLANAKSHRLGGQRHPLHGRVRPGDRQGVARRGEGPPRRQGLQRAPSPPPSAGTGCSPPPRTTSTRRWR